MARRAPIRRPVAHPLWDVMRREGRMTLWLAEATGFSESYVRGVKAGYWNASPNFKQRVCEALNRPETELFLSESPKRHGDLVGR